MLASPTTAFLVITFGISVAAGLAAFAIGGDRTFEDARALPLLLLTIWSPNVAAAIVTVATSGDIHTLIDPFVGSAPAVVWLTALAPLAVAAWVGLRLGPGLPAISPALALTLLATNLVMGPLGEEVGWRGFLLPRAATLGLVPAAIVVGVVWALWHLPLWWLPSPHRDIPYPVFFATVVCFSMVMTAMWSAGGGALGPIVAFHLFANVGVGWLEVGGRTDAATAYRRCLPLYATAALAAAGWLTISTPGSALV